jgi:hypothetical protein
MFLVRFFNEPQRRRKHRGKRFFGDRLRHCGAIALYQKSLLLIYHLHPVHPLIMVILILTNLVLTSRNNYFTLML